MAKFVKHITGRGNELHNLSRFFQRNAKSPTDLFRRFAGIMTKEGNVQKGEISEYILDQYIGLVAVDAWGEQSFFYNPDGRLPRGVYFATLKDKDGDNDKASKLGRDGVFRFNFGVSKQSFERVLGERPARPAAGGVVDTGHDFTQLNALLPHPVYAWMSWVCILNPDQDMFRGLAPFLNESYDLVVKKYAKRIKS